MTRFLTFFLMEFRRICGYRRHLIIFGVYIVAVASYLQRTWTYVSFHGTGGWIINFIKDPGFLQAFDIIVSQPIGLLASLTGLALGFDSLIGGSTGTLKRRIGKVIFVFGRALSSLAFISLSIGGAAALSALLTMMYTGLQPLEGDVWSIAAWILSTILYSLLYYSISMLISAVSGSILQSFTLSLVVWILFNSMIPYVLAPMIAEATVGPAPTPRFMWPERFERWISRFTETERFISMLSPAYHYSFSSKVLLQGVTSRLIKGSFMVIQMERLPIPEALSICWVNLSVILAITLSMFTLTVIIFKRQKYN